MKDALGDEGKLEGALRRTIWAVWRSRIGALKPELVGGRDRCSTCNKPEVRRPPRTIPSAGRPRE